MKLTLTVATPEASRDDATHMAIVHGWLQGQTHAEWQGAFMSQRQDAEGNLYRVFSMPVADHVIDAMLALLDQENLQRPPQDEPDEDGNYVINMAAANRAHDMLRGNVWLAGDTPVPQVDPSRLVAVVGLSGLEALAAMGLEHTPQEEGL